jgi:membrane peptidoglycan carboxypeptidase
MADVYATFADGGVRNAPIAITKVVFPNGHVDKNWGKPRRERVLSEPVAGELTSILHQNVLGGTATKSAINCPTAAKTGTTNDLIDAWLDGFNSRYSTVVWMGYPNRRVSMTSVHGQPQQGGYLPADIWHAYMAPVTEGQPCAPLNESSAGISYAPFFGKFATTGQALANKEESEAKPKAGKKSHGKGPAKAAPNQAPAGPSPSPGAGPPTVRENGGTEPH